MKTILSLALVTAFSTLSSAAFADNLVVVNNSYSSVKVKTLDRNKVVVSEFCLGQQMMNQIQDLDPKLDYTVRADYNSGRYCDGETMNTLELGVQGFSPYSKVEISQDSIRLTY